MRILRFTALTLVAIASLTISACAQINEAQDAIRQTAETTPPPTINYDAAALAEIFPAIGHPSSVAWVQIPHCKGPQPAKANGQCGEVILAVVRLAPEKAHSLREDYITDFDDVERIDFDQSQEFELFPGAKLLDPHIPSGRYETVGVLSSPFTTPTLGTAVYLHEKDPILVIDATSR